MPPAARITDMHTCPMVSPGPVPHVGGPVITGAPTVIVAGMPQARITDQCTCVGPPDVIVKGSPTVIVCGQPAARIGDTTAHGGVIVSGAPNVLIGEAGAGGSVGMSSATPRAVGAAGKGPDAVDRPDEAASANSMTRTDFGKRFKTITDMELSDAIDLYEADTGKRLDPETVKTLFTDADKAKELLMKDKDIHTKFRDILNTNIPSTEEEAKKAGFKKMPMHKSVFHSPWYKFWQNSKYVSADGHREVVFDPNGKRVDTRKYLGTFNFFGPDQASNHKKADVDPYFKWGN